MRVIDPGHIFELSNLDGPSTNRLEYVKREGKNYPGNIGHHEGTNIQETMRVVISRLQYLNNQISCKETEDCIVLARRIILRLEQRAKRVKGKRLGKVRKDIENLSTCAICGHIHCSEECV